MTAWTSDQVAGLLGGGAAPGTGGLLDLLFPGRTRPERRALANAINTTAGVFPRCRCDLHPAMTDDEIRALGTGCATGFVCPRLDSIRRRLA